MKVSRLVGVIVIGAVAASIVFSGRPNVTDLFDKGTKAESVNSDLTPSVEKELDNEDLIYEEEIDYLADTTYIDEDGKLIVKNTDDIIVLVNKARNLPSDYKPNDLVVPSVRFSFEEDIEKRYLRTEAAKALEDLFNEAEKDGLFLYAVSGYRSYNTQKGLFDRKVERVGYEEANKVVAVPGQSEHQTGLAMDVSCKSVGFSLEEDFGQTDEGKWVRDNVHRFGFILRFQKEATDITGYSYEPWHIRYVGKDAANEIYEQNITLEEYLGF